MRAEPIEIFPCDPVLATDLHVRCTPSGHYILAWSFDDGTGPRLVARIAVPSTDIRHIVDDAARAIHTARATVLPFTVHPSAPEENRSD